jgi:predicted alpha-1,6-mannanase (GH76 family)
VLAVIALLGGAASGFSQTTAGTYHDRADQALQSFLLKFWNGGAQYLRNRHPSTDNQLTGYWTYAHGWEAVMDGVERSGRQEYYGWIETFYIGQNERGWIVAHYDDECWMTMALLRAYDLTGNVKYLNQAKVLFADIKNGWDADCCGTVRGGLWWDKAHTQKATASNAGAALAGARLYQRTGDIAYLDFARQVYSYWFTNMVNPTTFQVCDHINPNGEKVWWRFTYNEGLMIGAALELYEATGTAAYLNNAHNIAAFMIRNEVAATSYGNVLYDGGNDGCGGDCHQFKGPAYRYLMRLYSRTNRASYNSILKSSADAIWNLARNASATTFSVHWGGPPQASVDDSQQSAACIALSRFAQQYGSYPDRGIPENRFEAENATLRHVGVEATYGGFTGWGYVAGWLGNGTAVDFTVRFPTAGTHTVTIRYAAGAGNASRQILVNGVNAISNQSFPSTGAWSSYNTVTFTRAFPAGVSTLSLAYNSALGNANYLNVDHVTISTLTAGPPGPLLVSESGANRVLAWTTPGFLQAATNILGTWRDVAGNPASPVMLLSADVTGETKFYRLRR